MIEEWCQVVLLPLPLPFPSLLLSITLANLIIQQNFWPHLLYFYQIFAS